MRAVRGKLKLRKYQLAAEPISSLLLWRPRAHLVKFDVGNKAAVNELTCYPLNHQTPIHACRPDAVACSSRSRLGRCQAHSGNLSATTIVLHLGSSRTKHHPASIPHRRSTGIL